MQHFKLVRHYLVSELQLNIRLQFDFGFTRQVDVDDVLLVVADVKFLVCPYIDVISVNLSNDTCSITTLVTRRIYLNKYGDSTVSHIQTLYSRLSTVSKYGTSKCSLSFTTNK